MPTPAPPRALASIHDGSPTSDGNGVPLRRLAPWSGARGSEAFRALDPFLLLDHFGPMTLPPGTDVGFPPHPHKGFQTLTYLIQGAFRHRDSTGGRGTLLPGGAQLMTAGAGIVHEEMPVPEHLETGGPIEGVQLWINLPRALKGGKPGYEDIPAERMPWSSRSMVPFHSRKGSSGLARSDSWKTPAVDWGPLPRSRSVSWFWRVRPWENPSPTTAPS